MRDPIQSLFLESIRASSSAGGLDQASPQIKAELDAALERLVKQYGGEEGADMTAFPELTFKDPTVDPINLK